MDGAAVQESNTSKSSKSLEHIHIPDNSTITPNNQKTLTLTTLSSDHDLTGNAHTLTSLNSQNAKTSHQPPALLKAVPRENSKVTPTLTTSPNTLVSNGKF